MGQSAAFTGNRLTADGTYTYSYDSEGNMVGRTKTSNGEVTTFTYDFRNRLTEVLIKSSGGTTLQDDKFTYDIENRRIGKNTLSGGQSWTGYDGVNPYADFNSSGSLTFRYLYEPGMIDFLLARIDTSGVPKWYLTDKLGSVRLFTKTDGTILDQVTYDSFGNILTETSPSNGDRFKFTSREWDSEIGQYFYRARYYGPTIGRFESEDPLGFSSGDTDFYRYVYNNPITGTDSFGLGDVEVDNILIWASPIPDTVKAIYEKREGAKLFGGGLRLDYFITGKYFGKPPFGPMALTELRFQRTVIDHIEATVNGQLKVIRDDKAPQPDGPNPAATRISQDKDKKIWIYDNVDASIYFEHKEFLPAKKRAKYTFNVLDNKGQVLKTASITVTIDIDKDGKTTISPAPSAIPVALAALFAVWPPIP